MIVAALRSDAGALRQLLISALRKRFELLVSVPLLLEYEAVLKRPEHLRRRALRATTSMRFSMRSPQPACLSSPTFRGGRNPPIRQTKWFGSGRQWPSRPYRHLQRDASKARCPQIWDSCDTAAGGVADFGDLSHEKE